MSLTQTLFIPVFVKVISDDESTTYQSKLRIRLIIVHICIRHTLTTITFKKMTIQMILKLLLKRICLVQIRRLSRWSSSQKLVEGEVIILFLRVVEGEVITLFLRVGVMVEG